MDCRVIGVTVYKRYTHYIFLLALVITLSMFSSPAFAGWAVNGNAVWLDQGGANERIRLTENLTNQAGSAWIETQIDLDYSFDISFSIYLGTRDSNGADGISFALQKDTTGILAFGDTSGGGEWIGMNGICPSVSVEVDTWYNSNRGDPYVGGVQIDHVGINVYTPSGSSCTGYPDHSGAGPVQADPSDPNIEDGSEHDLRITWNATTHVMTVYFDGSQRLTYTNDIVNNVFDGDSMVYFGFAASTGGSYNEQYIIPNTPDVSANKGVSPSFVYKDDLAAGTELEYTINILNSGRVAAIGTQITDTLPEGFHYVTGSTTGGTTIDPTVTTSGGREVLVWDMSATPIPPYTGTMSISFRVSLETTLDPGTFTNDFSVSGDNFASISEAQTADVIVGPVDVTVTKAHTGDFYVGQSGAFTFSVYNDGPDYCEDIIIEDTLPNGLSNAVIAPGTDPNWSLYSHSGQTYQWLYSGRLNNGASLPTLTILVDVGGAAYPSVTNTATVTSDSQDQDSSNDSSTDTVTVHALADLSVTKTHEGDFGANDYGTYEITVSNIGPNEDPATNIYVMDTLPAGLSYSNVSGTGWSLATSNGQDYTFTHAGPLASGADMDALYVTVYAAASAVGTVTNTATVGSATNDGNESNNVDTDITAILPSVDLSVSKAHAGTSFIIGNTVDFEIQVANGGPNDENGPITVVDTLPAGLTYVSHSGTGWSLADSEGQDYTFTHAGPLNNGATPLSLYITASVDADAYPTAVNTATVSTSLHDPNDTNDIATDTVTVEPLVDLSISKSHTGNFSVGAAGVYSIDVANTGSTADPGPIYVADTLPTGFSYTSVAGTGWSLYATSGQTYTFVNAGPLATGSSLATLYITVTPASGTIGTFPNTATVSSGATDSDSSNNTATDPTTVTDNVDLEIEKSHTGSFTVSANGTYTIEVSNNSSNAEAGPIYVVDTLPTGLQYVGHSGTGWSLASSSGQDYTFTHAGPLAGNSPLDTLEVEVFAQPSALGTVTNSATVFGISTDINSSNNTDTDSTNVVRPSIGNKPLYLRGNGSETSSATRVLSRDKTAVDNTRVQIDGYSGGGYYVSRLWQLSPVLQQSLVIPEDVDQHIYIQLEWNNTGRWDTYREVAAALRINGTLIDYETISVPTGRTSGSDEIVFTVSSPSDIELEMGDVIQVEIYNFMDNQNQRIWVHPIESGAYSYLDLTTDTVIAIDSLAVYDAAYSAGSVITSYNLSLAPGSIYARAVVSDPFGYADISSAYIEVLDSSSNIIYSTETTPLTTGVANTGGTRTFEWEIPITSSTAPDLYTLRVTAKEGTEELVMDVATTQFLVYLPPNFLVLKSAHTIYDPYNGELAPGVYPKAIPGSHVQYSVLVTNSGGAADLNSLIMTDPIDSNIELFVGDISGSGSGPVLFSCSAGSPPCGLTYTFSGLASTTDDVDFSLYTTGTDFSYVPDGSGDAFDDQVRRLRITPKGTFNAMGIDQPNCTFIFKVRVK